MAHDFGGESAVVFEASGDVVDIELGFHDGLAGIARFEFGQQARFAAHAFGKMEQQPPALLCRGLRPRTGIEGSPRRLNSGVDIGLTRVRNLGDCFFSRGIDHGKPGAATALSKFPVDEHAIAFHAKRPGSRDLSMRKVKRRIAICHSLSNDSDIVLRSPLKMRFLNRLITMAAFGLVTMLPAADVRLVRSVSGPSGKVAGSKFV